MAMSELAKHTLATSVVYQEGHNCGSCNDPIVVGKPGFLVQIVRAYVIDGVTQFVAALDEDGDPEYAAYFFHENCWEEAVEHLTDLNEDTPPTLVDGVVAGECQGCGSHILPGEICGIAAGGRAKLSDRSPDGEWALDWEMTDLNMLCSVCLNEVNLNLLKGLWDGVTRIRQGTECDRGVAARCWRYGPCDPEHCHISGEGG